MDNIRSLVAVLEDVLNKVPKVAKHRNVLSDHVGAYNRLLDKTTFADHQPYFYEIYHEYRDEILSKSPSDSWITKGVTVWYGHDVREVKPKNIKLPISPIYCKAVTIRSDLKAQEDLAKYSRALADVTTTQEPQPTDNYAYYYADEIIYYLLKILKSSIANTKHKSDVAELDIIISNLGKSLGIESETVRQRQGGGFDTVIKTIFDMASQYGLTPPEGTNPTTPIGNIQGDEFASAIQSLLGNDKLKESLSTALAGMNASGSGPTSIGDAISNLVKTVGPALTDAVGTMAAAPPPGVVDDRTPEQKAVDVQRVRESVANVGQAVEGITKSIDLSRFAKPTTELTGTTPK